MKRTKLRNNFLKCRCQVSKKTYNVQRNLCVLIVKKTNNEYFDNSNHERLTDDKNLPARQ